MQHAAALMKVLKAVQVTMHGCNLTHFRVRVVSVVQVLACLLPTCCDFGHRQNALSPRHAPCTAHIVYHEFPNHGSLAAMRGVKENGMQSLGDVQASIWFDTRMRIVL